MSHHLTTDTSIDEILENFSLLEEWEDRYSYIIELGKALVPLSPDEMTEENKIRGCVSQVWLVHEEIDDRIFFRGASDAHIVSGLVAITLAIFSGRSKKEILQTDEQAAFSEIGLAEHLTPQRSNGLRSMIASIRKIAQSG